MDLETVARVITAASAHLEGCGANAASLSDVRARLFAAIDNPSEVTWDAAYSLLVGEGLTLWQLAHRYGGYPVVARRPGTAWPAVPTRAQLLTALAALQPVR